jgi:biopolymer transport protein ExbB/TolQ
VVRWPLHRAFTTLSRTTATSGTNKKASKKAATTKSTSGRNAKTSLESLAERVAPPNKALVRIATRSVSRATLNQLGQSWASEDIIAVVPPFIGLRLRSFRRGNPAQ